MWPVYGTLDLNHKFTFKVRDSKLARHLIYSLIIISFILTLFSSGFFSDSAFAQLPGYDAVVTGKVWDKNIDGPAVNFTVEITGKTLLGTSTNTNKSGEYFIYVPSGDLTLEIKKNGKTYKKWDFTVERGQTKALEFEITTEKKDENPFKWLNLQTVIQNIIDHWYALIFLIALCIIAPILLTIVDKAFDRIHKKQFKFLDEKALIFLENITKYNVYIAFVILLLLILSILFPGFNDSIWKYIAPHIAAIYTIIILFILMRLFLIILRRIMSYLRGELSSKPKLKISPRYISILEIVLKYLIMLIFGVNILIIALAIFGMGDLISKSISDFFAKNSGYLIFIIIIVILMYFGGRFLRSFIDDMKRKDTARFSPEIADMAGKAIKIMIYVLGAMIIIFALLQMGGMGQLGQTLILILSIVIGLVVSMAATGSIGNVLTSFVLNAFRPYEIGDRVKIGEVIGDVETTNLAFVRIRTLNKEIVEIPNNSVIADKIINYSKSGAFAVNVDVGIGYNVPAEHVKKFLIEAARETKDIEDDPRPQVIITNMGDYAITYKLRAYTTNAKVMFQVRSNLMMNVQKQFYEHGVEILSPWYLVQREDKMPTSEEVRQSWTKTDKETEEVFIKDQEESITDSFGLMDKTLNEEKQM